MANAQRMTSEDKFDSSIQFINMVNDTSDVLNIKHEDEGRWSLDRFKMVFASLIDPRFKVSSDSVLTIDEINMLYYNHGLNNNY